MRPVRALRVLLAFAVCLVAYCSTTADASRAVVSGSFGSPTDAGAPPPVFSCPATLESSGKAGGFGTGAYLSYQGASGPSLASGSTVGFLFDWPGSGSSDAIPVSYSEGIFGTGDGWLVDIASNVPIILIRPSYSLNTATTLAAGTHAMAITMDPGTGKIRSSIDGAAVGVDNIPSYVAATATTQLRIGTGNSSANLPFVGSLYELKRYSVVLSDADLRAVSGTPTTNIPDNRWMLAPSAASEGSVTFDWRANQDWAGAATSTVGGITLTETGAPTYTDTSECVVTRPQIIAAASDNSYGTGATTPAGWTRISTYANSAFATNATSITADIVQESSVIGGAGQGPVFTTSSGTLIGTFTAATLNRRTPTTISLSGGPNYLTLEGPQTGPTGSPPPFGSYVYALRFTPAGLLSLGTPTEKTNIVCEYGDSIGEGQNASTWGSTGWAMLLRQAIASEGYSMALEDWGFRSLYDDVTTKFGSVAALATQIVKTCQLASGTKKLAIMIGTNDFGLSLQSDTAFGTMLQNVVNQIAANDATIQIHVFSPVLRTDIATNSLGKTLAQYRTAESTLTGVTYHDGTSIITSGDLYTDNLHPVDSGHAKIKTWVQSGLGL